MFISHQYTMKSLEINMAFDSICSRVNFGGSGAPFTIMV